MHKYQSTCSTLKDSSLTNENPVKIDSSWGCSKRRYFEEFWKTKQMLVPINFHWREINSMEVNGDQQLFDYQQPSKYILLCLTSERNLYRFGTTWRWVIDDNIFNFGWTIPLNTNLYLGQVDSLTIWPDW